ncbi:hypothetical protein LUZ63_010445 [Rhynchospora breviuscula]|uniref:UDP-N-acetylmuramoyl-L-alanyl-D-glutamate--2,6-diaminopimelate ligase MurE homolog, chloroplastic n=1 Tax=Rhynchospora breviuscula TaxID=2022672 RepID=A0A9Q0HPM3_9POAL|nr:hypothetical protein LUZ63_010445 [Rhynchospora breviuscula]
MYLTLPFHCSHLSLSTSRPFTPSPLPPLRRRPFRLAAFGRNRSQPLQPGDDPPEAPEDTSHGLSRRQIFERQVERARRRLEAQSLDLPDSNSSLSGPGSLKNPPLSPPEDVFLDVDQAIYQKQPDLVKAAPPLAVEEVQTQDELSPEEEQDVNEINDLQAQARDAYSTDSEGDEDNLTSPSINGSMPSFNFNLDMFGKERIRILDPKFSMTLAELLDESKVVPVSVNGDLEVSIGGVQNDPREVTAGDLFICGANPGESSGITPLTEADKRGAVAVVADKEINIDEKLACRALVIVEDTSSVVASLAAAFYGRPSEKMPVIGVAGSSGVTSTVHLIRAMYEASGRRTGMLSVVGHYVHGNNHLESPDDPPTIPDAFSVQKMLATMIHNGSEAVAMDSSIDGNGDEIDYDIAVFTNLRYEDADANGSKEEYMKRKARVFVKMVDPSRHRKVVNIDDPKALYFLSQGSPDVPVVTYAMENKKADVHVIKHRLSLFETEVLVQTPHGILEISSGLLCMENVYSILAAVAVGVAVGVPLEDIVRGVEEVDAVPGRIELIDEEQTFGVVVDHARTPEALSKLLDTVKELGPRRIITVVGCCGEGERGKRPLMTKIAAEKSDVVMLTSDNPKNEDPLNILDDMLVGVGWTMQDYLKYGENDYYPPLKNGHRLFLHDIRTVAVRSAVAMGEEGDIVVVTGKGSDSFQIEGDKKQFFDDREECREALQYVYELHKSGIDTSEFPWRLPESH